MATDEVSGIGVDNHQSVPMTTHIASSSPDPGCDSLRKFQQFPKHDTVKLCLCDTLMAGSNFISEQEQISIILAGLSMEYESIRVVASAMSVPLDLLAEMLVDYEARQQDLVSSMPLQVNVAQQSGSNDKNVRYSARGSRPSYRGNGSRSF
ncbi:hypothetical protein PVK06_034669 [Gossypium arboreum]|uniref:Uncharacterized protein n=1 Tax=Gossypium arboreum TaxID=29729 RepID=A0ABR0NGY5_GOSAR|nr:hypothetical protein PVK06_034669 [Gossypium arboreum]